MAFKFYKIDPWSIYISTFEVFHFILLTWFTVLPGIKQFMAQNYELLTKQIFMCHFFSTRYIPFISVSNIK